MKSNTLPITAALPQFPGVQLPIHWVKELRVILPLVLGCAACLLLSPLLPYAVRVSILQLLYPITCSAVFALAFGHDYMHRTITSALSLPVARGKQLRARVLLCIAVLAPLALIDFILWDFQIILALTTGGADRFARPWYTVSAFHLLRVVEPILIGLCLAPWLTILSRSVLFGTLISLIAPIALDAIVQTIASAAGHPVDSRLYMIQIAITFILLIIGAILSYRRVMTQEAIDHDASLTSRARTPSASAAATPKIVAASSRPIRQLIKKEFMLHRLAAAIATLCVIIVLFSAKDHAELLSAFYPATMIILIGSIASAEERRMGVIPSQVAHPISFRTQWLTKIGVAYVAALIFAILLPLTALLLKTGGLKNLTTNGAQEAILLICGGTLLILSITIYISSISENAMRAMLASLFILIVSMMVLGAAYNAYSEYLWRLSVDDEILQIGSADRAAWHMIELQVSVRTFAITMIGFIPLTLYFAMQNHRCLDRSGSHLFRQAGVLIIYALAALVVISLAL